MTAAVTARGVTVLLGGTTALDGVSLDVERGTWVGLIGPNGAGKTTLLRTIAGLTRFRGTLTVDSCDPSRTRRRELARHVTYVPQDPQMPPAMTVREYALLGRTAHLPYFGVESHTDLAVTATVLESLRLARFATRPLSTLSGGERQRAVLARALTQASPVLLLDEPTSALDLGQQHGVLELVDELRLTRGLTVVSAIHDVTLAAQFADRLVVVAGGRDVATGRPREVLTEELLAEHWNIKVRVSVDAAGAVAVVPLRRRARIGAGHG